MKVAAIVIGAALAIVVATVVLFGSTRRDLPAPASVPVLPEDLDTYLREREARFDDLRPGAAKRIAWADSTHRTPLVVVYLHGFSATRQETAPLAEEIASDLGANLFQTRLRGHGRDGDAMAEATVADWLGDVREAMAIGERLGERTVLIGNSTGGTLALWAATRPEWRDRLAAVVLLSPNLGPRDPAAGVLLWPGGLTVAKWIVGPDREWEPQNERQAAHWNTRYPLEAAATMMRLVAGVRRLDLGRVTTPVLLLHSDRDTVVRTEAALDALARLGSARKQALVVDPGDEEGHVLAGDVLSSGTTRVVRDAVVGFVRETTAAGPTTVDR